LTLARLLARSSSMVTASPSPVNPRAPTRAPLVEAHRTFLHELFARTRRYLEHRSDINEHTRRRSSCRGVLSSQKE